MKPCWQRNHKHFSLAVILILILLPSINTALLATASTNGAVLYYVYGTHQCPHCRNQVAFFSKEYPNNYYFCDMATSYICQRLFVELIEATHLEGVVPTILVVKNNSVVAVVQGEDENRTFWDSLAKLNTSTTIPVYTSGRVIGSLRISNMTLFVNTFIVVLGKTSTTNTISATSPASYTSTATSTTNNTRIGKTSAMLAGVISLVLAAVIVYFVWREYNRRHK